ncbi:MAG: hypothetical protein IID61_06500 [SAR324 cluster bacterium]|nr:hypothetical protein [SAR324 cluster bacterium]
MAGGNRGGGFRRDGRHDRRRDRVCCTLVLHPRNHPPDHPVPISRAYRDGRLMGIGGGADEVMLRIISKGMGIFPSE